MIDIKSKTISPLTSVPLTPVNPLKEARDELMQAEELRRQGKLDRAESICTKLLRRYPIYVAALHTLGLIHADRNDPLRALGPLFRAAMLNPRSWRTLTALSGVCLALEGPQMAAEFLEQARRLNPQDPNVLITLAEIYRNEREYELARDAFRNAIDLDPDFSPPKIGLAQCYVALGETAEAVNILEGLVKRGVRSLAVLGALGQLPISMTGVDVLKELEQIARPENEDPKEFTTSLAFARAAALDRAGRYAEAWEEVRSANRTRVAAMKADLNKLKEQERANLAWLKANPIPLSDIPADKQAITLLILGPSRSGKTSLEKLVGTLAGVKRGYENPSLDNAISRAFQEAGLITSWNLEYLPPQFKPSVREIYLEELAQRAGSARVFTNTNPGHIHSGARLAPIVRNVRFVFVKRNIDDITLRIFMRNYLVGNPYAYDLKSIREHIIWNHEMMDRLAQKLPEIVRIVHYEDMVANPLGAVSVAAELCGLPMPEGPLPALGDDRGCAEPYRKFMAAEING